MIERIDHYRVIDKIGAGGMGEVYRAVDERLGRSVALKLLPPGDAARTQRQVRLVREAQAAGNLNHPGIVTIHDVGRYGDRSYVVMELVQGRPLTELCGRVEPASAVALCAQAAEALAAAHERGILHRDIKPDNIMVTADRRLKVLDFGLAKLRVPTDDAVPVASVLTLATGSPAPAQVAPITPVRDDTGTLTAERSTIELAGADTAVRPSLTQPGALIGTPAYMSPEQAAGDPYDERSEVYSLGLVLHELVSGRRALEREDFHATVAAALAADVAPLRTAEGRRVPRRLERLLARALARDPGRRFGDMRELAAALLALERRLTGRWLRRASGAGLAVAAVAIGAFFALRAPRDGTDGRGGSGGSGGGEGRGGSGGGEGASWSAAAIADVTANRRVTFDPGCEMTPSFTPDGREILFSGVFERDYEVVALDLATSRRRRVTQLRGWDVGPVASPDGRRIAFVHFGEGGRELHVAEAGRSRLIGQLAGMPAWTAKGELLFGDDAGKVLRLDLDAGGRAPVELASLPDAMTASELRAFTDGAVAFQARGTVPEQTLLWLGVIEPDGRVRMLDREPTADDQSGLAIDRAGRGLYYAVRTPGGVVQTVWRDRAGGEPIPLPALPASRSGIDMTADGRRMVQSTCRELRMGARLRSQDVIEPLEERSEWSVRNLTAVDQRRVLLATDRSGRPQIWLLESGRAPRVLVDVPADQPSTSGRDIAWVGRDPARSGIFARAFEGGPARRLTDGDGDVWPMFSRDGGTVYFLRSSGEMPPRVHAVPAAGGESRPVTPRPVTPPGVAEYAVSPAADLLAYVPIADMSAVMIGPPGGPFARVPGVPPGTYQSPWFSRDGKRLLLVRGAVEVVTISLAGKSAGVVWTDGTTAIWHVEEAPDGDGLLAALVAFDGDLVLLDGRFR